MREQFIKNIRVLKKAIAERKLVVFAGAGISIDSGVPSWKELINELRSEINIPPSESDFLRIAQMYFNERQQKEFIDKIREVLRYKRLRYNPIHEAIFELNPEHIITTNFDDLLEQVIKSKAYPFSVIKKDNEFPYAHNTKLLVKLHGDLEEANLVIKEDDYLEYSSKHPLIEGFVKGIFSTKLVLFVGYSFSDLDLKIILQTVKNILGENFQNAYLLNTEEDFHPAQRQYLKSKGINVINYYDAGVAGEVNYIEQYLYNGVNSLNRIYSTVKPDLTAQGLKALNLLKFINHYSDFEESLQRENVLDQMYKSIIRFNEVKVLPPKFISNLYPFNNSSRYLHNYYKTNLGSNNPNVNSFFFDDFIPEPLSINTSFFKKNNISLNEKEDYEKKLHAIIEKLNFATIFRFGKTKSKIELFDHEKEFDETVSLAIPYKACDCLGCLLHRFKVKEFLKKLKDSSVTETSEIQNDLLIAYSNYKSGNFQVAYDQFEEIANKAWQLEKYISYYIAQRNIKYLRNLLYWSDETDERKRSEIVRKIDDLDLDKLLFRIPALADIQYKFLKIIRDDEVLTKAESNINEYFEKVIEVSKQYKRGGFSHGAYYPYLVQLELYKVFFFYNYNYLIEDVFPTYKNVFEKGIKTFLICYSIDDRYPQRLRSFDEWMIRFIVLYADHSALRKTLNEYEIKEIKIAKEDINSLIEYLNNLLQSIFNEENYLGRTISADDNISAQSKNFFFQSSLRNMLNNAFYIFAGIKIPEASSKKTIRNFLDFMATQEILIHGNSDYFNAFLNNVKDYFSEEDFDEALKISSEKNYYKWDEFYTIISFGIKTKYPNKLISDEGLIRTIVRRSSDRKNNTRYLGYLYLWKVCSETNKKVIQDSLVDILSKSFVPYSYLYMCYEGIVHPSLFYTSYISELEKSIPKDIAWNNEKPQHESFLFNNFIYMLYKQNVIQENLPFKQFEKYPDYWKFYFRPFEFDYSRFDPRWLQIVEGEPVHTKLREIANVKESLHDFLKQNDNEDLGIIFTKYYL